MYNYAEIIKYHRFFFIGLGLFLVSVATLAISLLTESVWLNAASMVILCLAIPFAIWGYLKILRERLARFFERDTP